MGVSQYEEAPGGPARFQPPPYLGPVVGLAERPGLDEHVSWSGWGDRVDHVDVGYKVVGGPELGRYLQGAVRTSLHPGEENWAAVEQLGGDHLREVLTRDYETSALGNPAWETLRIRLDHSAVTARYAIHDGYEGIAFPLADRIVSSVFSVFDAAGATTAFRTFTPRLPP